ncbi:hypothetical protein BJV78DRAFT_1214589 [Lactifluus subvellereus]|nr:hypothetical protein BJV78DRAFT_1214589 [Lactifluus subvellereus]
MMLNPTSLDSLDAMVLFITPSCTHRILAAQQSRVVLAHLTDGGLRSVRLSISLVGVVFGPRNLSFSSSAEPCLDLASLSRLFLNMDFAVRRILSRSKRLRGHRQDDGRLPGVTRAGATGITESSLLFLAILQPCMPCKDFLYPWPVSGVGGGLCLNVKCLTWVRVWVSFAKQESQDTRLRAIMI